MASIENDKKGTVSVPAKRKILFSVATEGQFFQEDRYVVRSGTTNNLVDFYEIKVKHVSHYLTKKKSDGGHRFLFPKRPCLCQEASELRC